MNYSPQMIKFLFNLKDKGLTYKEIAKEFNDKFGLNKSQKAIELTLTRYSTVDIDKAVAPPKILVLDIETSYMIARVWGPKVEYINHTDILQDFKILTVSYKFYGDKNPVTLSAKISNGKIDDKEMLKKLSAVINEADFVAGHNLVAFDMKKINTRIIANGLPPLQRKKTIDTIRIARSHFGFTSNRLDFLSKFLGVDPKGKMSHEGIGLWEKVMKGDKKALKIMLDYNEKDILLTEKVLEKLLPFSTVKIVPILDHLQCPQCLSLKLKNVNQEWTSSGIKVQFECLKCRHTFIRKPVKGK